MSDFSAFGNLERSGWLDAKRAVGYVELFASASDQAINSLLDAADASQNLKSARLVLWAGQRFGSAVEHRGCKRLRRRFFAV